MSIKSLEYAVLRLADSLPSGNSETDGIRNDVYAALGVTSSQARERLTEENRDKVAQAIKDDEPDDDAE
jgi:hypothetical protein